MPIDRRRDEAAVALGLLVGTKSKPVVKSPSIRGLIWEPEVAVSKGVQRASGVIADWLIPMRTSEPLEAAARLPRFQAAKALHGVVGEEPIVVRGIESRNKVRYGI